MEQLERSSRSLEKYNEEVARGVEIQERTASAFAETSIRIGVLQGTMSQLDAAQALAALHAHDHAEALERINKALTDQISLINSNPKLTDTDKSGAIRDANQGAQNQRDIVNGQYSVQRVQDQAAISNQELGPAMSATLGRIANSWENMTQSIIQVTTRALDGFNDQIVNAITGKKTNFGKVFSDAGAGLTKTALQSAEGHVMGALGLGKPDGTMHNPIYTMDAGSVVGRGGLSGNGIFRPFFGGQQDQGGQSGGSGSIFSQLLHGFFGGGDHYKTGSDGMPMGFQGGFANGGDFLANRPMLVGERRPEIITPDRDGSVIPLDKIGGGDTHIHIDARGSNDPMAVHAAVMRAAPHIAAAGIRATHQAKIRSPGGR